ncbi:MAG: acetyl-CoA carboxylase, carboxyltransferase subunit beta [Saprospiraceae bacterium]
MGWFKRLRDGIQTATKNKKEAPEGIWYKCEQCKHTSTSAELKENFYKCVNCNYHVRIGSAEYFELLFDNEKFTVHFDDIEAIDILGFKDLKPYPKRLAEAKSRTGLNSGLQVAFGKINKKNIVIACMDFSFIGGSLSSVEGEKISRAGDMAIENECPLLIISKSGGARMMESAFSLMQMAKTSVKLALMAELGIPYFSLMTDPTTGGVTASYAMLGDINMAEPKALIGFAGPRVIKEAIKKELPEDFQSSEYLLEHGFLDFIIDRKDLKIRLDELLTIFQKVNA